MQAYHVQVDLKQYSHKGTDHLENLSALGRGKTYPIGIRQSRALLFSIMLELISPGLFVLRRDIVSTLNTQDMSLQPMCFMLHLWLLLHQG